MLRNMKQSTLKRKNVSPKNIKKNENGERSNEEKWGSLKVFGGGSVTGRETWGAEEGGASGLVSGLDVSRRRSRAGGGTWRAAAQLWRVRARLKGSRNGGGPFNRLSIMHNCPVFCLVPARPPPNREGTWVWIEEGASIRQEGDKGIYAADRDVFLTVILFHYFADVNVIDVAMLIK